MKAQTIALTAVCIALVAVLVAIVPIPIPATGGYTHPGAVAEIFVAVAFGPLIGAISAGIGAAIADLSLGYGSFAPLTFIAHASLGLLAGWLGWKKGWAGMFIGWLAGGLALVLVYFLGEAYIYGFGAKAAAAEVPINLFQVSLGVLGILLYRLVKSAYPQIDQLLRKEPFEEV